MRSTIHHLPGQTTSHPMWHQIRFDSFPLLFFSLFPLLSHSPTTFFPLYIPHIPPFPKPCSLHTQKNKNKKLYIATPKIRILMGNCICHQSSVQVVGQDQGSPAADRIFPSKTSCDACDIAKEILGDKSGIRSSTTEIKIKITKKQLEQLLSRVDVKELSVQPVLAQLMNLSDKYETQQRSWRPALQSIPE